MMIWPALKRTNAFVFNASMVEARWAKCAYLWDGATNNKFFRGCGTGATGCCEEGCGSAFHNICPSTGKPCTADSVEVKEGACRQFGGNYDAPETHGGDYQCYYPGTAIKYHEQAPAGEWEGNVSDSKLREMCKDRVKYNSGRDQESWNLRKHNEVVLDELLLLEDIRRDPAAAIPAVLYTTKGGTLARDAAIKMRDEIGKYTGLDDLGKIPVVGIYNLHPRPNPFYVEGHAPGPVEESPQSFRRTFASLA